MNKCLSITLFSLVLVPLVPVPASARRPPEITKAAPSATTVPIELREKYPILTIRVDDMDVPVQLDIGDRSALVLQQSILDRAGAVPTGQALTFRDAKGNSFESPTFKVARVQIGSAVFTDVIARLDVHHPSYPAAQVGQKGFLGTGLLKSYEVVLDYPNRTVTLVPQIDGNRLGTCEGAAVPFSAKWNGEPVTEADTDLGRATLWWDTGAPTSMLSKEFVRKGGSRPFEDTMTTEQLILGGDDFGPSQFEIRDMTLPGFDGFIGYDFFLKHAVCIDFPRDRLVVRGQDPR